jgi:amino acid transporter
MKKKFGTFKGVFVPSVEAILGTVLFLLLPVLTADAGLLAMIAVIILSHTITVATSFSLADCATNLHRIGGGGIYALSKRSLGNALGGSIGIQLYLAQAASIGFYCIGFAEPVYPLLSSFFYGSEMNGLITMEEILFQKQLIASLIFILFFFIVLKGADFTLKIQMFILYILFGSIGVIFISPFLGLEFQGGEIFYGSMSDINLRGMKSIGVGSFFLLFTQFFPAVTGISAGAGMSGDLKKPKQSMVSGTYYAIVVTFMLYMAAAFLFSMVDRNLLVTGYSGEMPYGFLITEIFGLGKSFPENIPGLLLFAGIIFATSSSALSSFISAPRTLQSLAHDDIVPRFLKFLGNDFRKGGHEPRYSALVTFFIGMSIIWIGNLNQAAIIVGICFLGVYGWLNLSAFLERISGNPTFRPTSKGHWLISLYGFLSSVVAVLLFNWIIGIIIIAVQFLLFRLIVKYRPGRKLEGVWWGVLFRFVSRGLSALNSIVQGKKNWRPILTAISFSGKENCPDKISYLAELMVSYKGMVNFNLLVKNGAGADEVDISSISQKPGIIRAGDLTESVLSLVQTNNPGGIVHNTVLIEHTHSVDLVKVIGRIIASEKNILMLKNGERFIKNEVIDIWWRGERNGNLMVLLAYIMKSSLKPESRNLYKIRIIRRLDKDEDQDLARKEMERLLRNARLDGEIVILPYAKESFTETLHKFSGSTDLIMMGVPGNYTEKEKTRFFNLNQYFFKKEIEKYNDLPAILFVKSAYVMDLIED